MSAWTAADQAEYERDCEFDEWGAEEAERAVWSLPRRSSELLYLIWAVSTPYVKIGVTADLPRRLRALQTGCPHELRVLAQLVRKGGGAEDVERYLHDRLESWHYRGEWFEILPETAIDVFWTAVEWWAADNDVRIGDPVGVA